MVTISVQLLETATYEHPFWVPSLGAWVEARNRWYGSADSGRDHRLCHGQPSLKPAGPVYAVKGRGVFVRQEPEPGKPGGLAPSRTPMLAAWLGGVTMEITGLMPLRG